MSTETPQAIYLKDYQPPAFLIDEVDLAFDLGEDLTAVQARLTMRRNPEASPGDGVLRLNGEQLELQSVSLDGRALKPDDYALDKETLKIPAVPENFVLDTRVHIRPQTNRALEGLYKSGGMFCTQCEAEGFRRITYFLDRPDVMSRFRTSITADRSRYPVLLSNGNAVEAQDLGDGRHRVSWEDPYPKPCYLFALVAGDLRHIEDSYTTASGRVVALRIYVEPANIDKCDHAMRSLKKAMRWDEQRYGREYDLDIYMIVAVNDFNMGAMENKGLNIFNSQYVLARPETATDSDYQNIEGVIAHEYFHNWTGNRITCRDWFQLSLKEGLTVFRDQQFSADMGSPGVKRIEDVRILRSHQFAEDAGPMAHPVRPASYIEINNFYTMTVYNKGAEVIRMQRNLLGAEGFRKGMDLYFDRHDGQAVTTDEFVRCMQDACGRDMGQFQRWYHQAGTPHLRVDGCYDEQSGTYTLEVRQSCPESADGSGKEPFDIPLALGLLETKTGREIALTLQGETPSGATGRVLELRRPRERFCFVDIPARPVPSLLRGFSAPVKVDFDYSDEDLMLLMAHDSDDFNRWDASQELVQRSVLEMVAHRRQDRPMQVPQGVVDAFEAALADESADKSLLAEMLHPPSESYLGDQMETVDVEGIHAAREAFLHHLASALKDRLSELYRRNTETGGYDIQPDSIGRRALKNACLSYLMQLQDPEIHDLCMRQFRQAFNMTDLIAALALLAGTDCPQRLQALEAFADRWKGDPLVMDKWFSVQAMSKLPDVLHRVEALMRHPAFSITNPNKVRSLIGAFCSGNVAAFHRADGSGYAFLASRVMEIDPINPQVAARLVRSLVRWRRYDPGRQEMIKLELQRILDAEKLSRDVFEVVSKSLAVV